MVYLATMSLFSNNINLRIVILFLASHCFVIKAYKNSWVWRIGTAQSWAMQSTRAEGQQASAIRRSMSVATNTPPTAADSLVSTESLIPYIENSRPSTTDRARTITHICTSGTLCTSYLMEENGSQSFPFGSYVDYILDENGWPVMLLSEQSLHTHNIDHNPAVSLFVQLPRSHQTLSAAALSRVTVLGKVEDVPKDQLVALKFAFTVLHPYAEQIVDSKKFKLVRIQPEKIYFSGGFGVQATWVDVEEYSQAKPDVLAQDVPNVLARVNIDKQNELTLLCKHYLHLKNVDFARIQAIDRLGIDIRVTTGELTDEYRVCFRYPVNSAEDAKSELTKLFQEVWEREQGYFFTDELPKVSKYAEDILRNH